MADRVNRSDSEWKERLTPEQYEVCRLKGTERAFTGRYYDCKDDGVYRCACCSSELFSSEAKYDSGTGWPSFFQSLAGDRVKTELDTDHGMVRTEVLCARCGAHLGHLFDDGPEPTSQRYCMNSVALELERKPKG